MILQAGDLNILLNTGMGFPDEILQRREEGEWVDYLVEGKPVHHPVKIETLPPGQYRMANPGSV